MAITEIQLTNFKCFADSGAVPLAPLTIIFGRNNTGKSSILQSMLLLRQTLDSPEYGVPRLNLRGPLYLAGAYTDIVHQHLSRNHIGMSFKVESESGPPAHLQLEFSADEPNPPRLSMLRVAAPSNQALEIHRSVGQGGPYELKIGDDIIGGGKKANFSFPVNQFLPLIGDEPPRVGRPNQARARSRAAARRVLREFTLALGNARTLGAFRQSPARRYEYEGRTHDVVDPLGQNVVNALIEDATRRRRKGELIKRVNHWLKTVGRVRLMPIRSITKSKRVARIFEIRLRDTDSGRWANFADVGFGIGQALPVFVEGLRTQPNGTFLVQEPEIHLHPDAQLGMADFLIDLVTTGRRVIVETHSEHLLLRIRHRILASSGPRASPSELKATDVSIVYVTKNANGAGVTKPIKVDELGQLQNWPTGFMEEATQERMDIMEDMAKRVEKADA